METLLSLTLSGSALALLLLLLKKLLGRRLSSTLYYYAWLLVLLRFLLPLPGLVPLGQEANSSTPSHRTRSFGEIARASSRARRQRQNAEANRTSV